MNADPSIICPTCRKAALFTTKAGTVACINCKYVGDSPVPVPERTPPVRVEYYLQRYIEYGMSSIGEWSGNMHADFVALEGEAKGLAKALGIPYEGKKADALREAILEGEA